MKKLLFFALILILAACSQDDTPSIKEFMSVKPVVLIEDGESGASLPVAAGFLLREYDGEKALQNSVWRLVDGKWVADVEPIAVNGSHIAAVFPSDVNINGDVVTFGAGIDNMTAFADIDRSITDDAELVFSHRMFHLACTIKDSKGKDIKDSEIKSLSLVQPLNMSFNLLSKESVIGEKGELVFSRTGNYIIPGGEYQVKLVMADGRRFSYRPTTKFVAGMEYVLNLSVDDEEMSVALSVQRWGANESMTLSLEKVVPEKPVFDWIKIEPGKFKMGGNSSKDDDIEKPVHEVVISKAFYLSAYLVTFEQYDMFCDATGRTKPDDEGWGRGKRPVINVNWQDAHDFCEWAGVKLPTEAQWEYACRAGTNSRRYWGDGINKDRCNYNWEVGKTTEVGLYAANPWGLYDMLGNVWEWCSDWFGKYSAELQTDPCGPSSGDRKVYRGASWLSVTEEITCSRRGAFTPHHKYKNVGFRIMTENLPDKI